MSPPPLSLKHFINGPRQHISKMKIHNIFFQYRITSKRSNNRRVTTFPVQYAKDQPSIIRSRKSHSPRS